MSWTSTDQDGSGTGIFAQILRPESMNLDGSAGYDSVIGNDLDNQINGLGGDDLLKGEGGNDTLSGGSGNDELHGGAGDDVLDGGLGTDTVVLSGAKSDYQLRYDATTDRWTTTHITTGEVDRLSNVETVQFDQDSIDLTTAPVAEDGSIVLNASDTATWQLGASGGADGSDEGSDVTLTYSFADGGTALDQVAAEAAGFTHDANVSVYELEKGYVQVQADGSYEFKAKDGAVGEDSFTFSVTDEVGNVSYADMSVGISQPHVQSAIEFDGNSALRVTPAEEGNTQTWTWSGWVKRDSLGDTALFTSGYAGSGGDLTGLIFDSAGGTMTAYFGNSSGDMRTTETFASTSEWYHVVLSADTTQATDRLRLFVNGQQYELSGQPAQGATGAIGTTQSHTIGAHAHVNGDIWPLDGQMSDIHFVDGLALDATDFGRFDADGNWLPTHPSVSDYGVNGFHLDFADETNLSADASGNGNDLTETGTFVHQA
ncbi:LamG-like jellyroll fold domain-containing protein, partial [Terasakiella sp. A23]|uniref:LamG-like jellyroll fold domain-containing protein n=1 Tax=Terasakiella sp. FCG-A23 TaxID=3080561 RepID=UPI002952CC5E